MRFLFYFFIVNLITGCATSYVSTSPSNYSYKPSLITDSLEYSLCFNVLEKTGNTRFSKIEKKKNMELVAVKLINHTNTPLTVTEENLKFLAGGFNVLYES